MKYKYFLDYRLKTLNNFDDWVATLFRKLEVTMNT